MGKTYRVGVSSEYSFVIEYADLVFCRMLGFKWETCAESGYFYG